eukprot:IDg3036t1
MTQEGRRRRDRRITRAALQHPNMSAFTYLFGSSCNQSLITTCGLDHAAFRILFNRFAPLYNAYSPYSSSGHIRRLPNNSIGGRPRSMTALQCLALSLAWMRSRGAEHYLSLIFGVTGSVCSLFIRFGRRILVRVLANDTRAQICMPTDNEVDEFKMAFERKYEHLQNVYCVADGLKLLLEQSGDVTIQNRYYNGWQHDHY